MKRLLIAIFILSLSVSAHAAVTHPVITISDKDGAAVEPRQLGTTFNQSQTVVGLTAVPLGATTGICQLLLTPNSSNTRFIYIGNSNVTTANGFEIATARTTELNMSTVSGLYAISSAANQRLTVFTVTK